MQIITPAPIPSDLSHQSVFNRHTHIVVRDHAQSLFDKNAFTDNITSQPAQVSTDTTSVSEPAFMRPKNADTFKEYLENEEFSPSRNKRSLRNTIFESGEQSSDWNSISTDMTLSNLFQILIDSNKYTLLNRDRSEKMFTRIEISNDHARNATGLEYQLVCNKRFKTFVDLGMWEARKFFTYAKSGISDPLFSGLFQQDTLIDYDLGDRTVKTLKKSRRLSEIYVW